MATSAYIVSISKSLKVENIIEQKPELRTYTYNEENFSILINILQELKTNLEVELSGSFSRKAILYYIIDYIKENNQLLGSIKINGKSDRIINVEVADIKESTKHQILQHGLLDGIMRRLNEL